jgi:Protein of unknown function (DUF3048) C-terminal domain/Protein of unknown function (DUF3048) N-terminal domain
MPRGRPIRQPAWATVPLAAAIGLTVAACGAGSGPASSPSPRPTATPTSTSTAHNTASESGPTAPLTGLPAASAADAARPAVALDVSGSSPTGLGAADVVFEEVSAPMRYIAVYQSKQADGVGPITGTQPTDGQVLGVLHALIGYDGASVPYFVATLDKSKGVTDEGYSRYPSLYASGPQGLTASTGAFAGAVSGAKPPPQLFRYRGALSGADTLSPEGVSRPDSVNITIPGYGEQHWTYDARTNLWSCTGGGPQAQVANLVVQTVPYRSIGDAHNGITVASASVIGTGQAEVFSGKAPTGAGGTAASGTWSKPHFDDVTNYLDASGAPMAFQPGQTWIILAPQGTQISTSGG